MNIADEFDKTTQDFEASFVAECYSTAFTYRELAREFNDSERGDAEWRESMAKMLNRKAAAFCKAAETIRAVR